MTHHRTTSAPIGGDHPPIGTRAVFELRIPNRGDRYTGYAGGILTANQPNYPVPVWVLVELLAPHTTPTVTIDDRHRPASMNGDGPGDAHLIREAQQ